ncbi:MAG: phasin family protein [Magnetococcales bacterium]|nr:phasin family protein [Magnetococcales bacterium]
MNHHNYMETFSGMSSQYLKALNNMQKISSQTVESLVSQQIHGIEDFVVNSSRHLMELAQSPTTQEVIATQVRIFNEMGENALAQTKGSLAILDESRDQLDYLYKSEMKSLVRKASQTTI